MAKNKRLGTYITSSVASESYRAFVPSPLPPEPAIDLAPLAGLLANASKATGRLDGVADILLEQIVVQIIVFLRMSLIKITE